MDEAEKADLLQELNNEKAIREKLQGEIEELEKAMVKARQQHESRAAALALENDQLTSKLSELESERIDQEEKLQNALSELRAKEAELRELRMVAGSEASAKERADRVRKIEDEFASFEAGSSGYREPGSEARKGEEAECERM